MIVLLIKQRENVNSLMEEKKVVRNEKKQSEQLTAAAEVNNRSAKPEEMQMTGEPSTHREQPVFLWPTMQSDVSYCARLGYGNRPWGM